MIDQEPLGLDLGKTETKTALNRSDSSEIYNVE